MPASRRIGFGRNGSHPPDSAFRLICLHAHSAHSQKAAVCKQLLPAGCGHWPCQRERPLSLHCSRRGRSGHSGLNGGGQHWVDCRCLSLATNGLLHITHRAFDTRTATAQRSRTRGCYQRLCTRVRLSVCTKKSSGSDFAHATKVCSCGCCRSASTVPYWRASSVSVSKA